jgi:hypothetical protein
MVACNNALGAVAILAVQFREQEYQEKKPKRPNNHSNPCPDFEGSSSTLSNSAGKIDRADHQRYKDYIAIHYPRKGAPSDGRGRHRLLRCYDGDPWAMNEA